MLIVRLLFIMSIFLLGTTQAADLEDSLKELHLKLGQCKGKLETLKSSLENLKNSFSILSIVSILQEERDKFKTKKSPDGLDKKSALVWATDKTRVMNIITEIINALKNSTSIDLEDLNLIGEKAYILDGVHNPVIKIAEGLKKKGASAPPTKVPIVTPQLKKELDITVSLRNSLKQLIPIKAEFNDNKDYYINTFCSAIGKYTKGEIESTTERFGVSAKKCEARINKIDPDGLASFQNNFDNMADFFSQLYLDRFFENSIDYNDFTMHLDPSLMGAVLDFLKACKKFYDKNFKDGSDFKTKLMTKYKQVEKSRVAIQNSMKQLMERLDTYSDTTVLDHSIIEKNILIGDALGNFHNFGKTAYYEKAEKILKNSITLQYFKNNFVDKELKKIKQDLLDKFKKNIIRHSCNTVLDHLKNIEALYDEEIKQASKAEQDQQRAEQEKKQVVIDDILIDDLHKQEYLEKMTLGELNALLIKLKSRRGSPQINHLEALIISKKPAVPPPPGMSWDASTWPTLSDSEIQTIIDNRSLIASQRPLDQSALKAIVEKQKADFSAKGNEGAEVLVKLGLKKTLEALIISKKPVGPPPPPGMPWDASTWPTLTDSEIQTIIDNRSLIESQRPLDQSALKAIVEKQKAAFSDKGNEGEEVLVKLGLVPVS